MTAAHLSVVDLSCPHHPLVQLTDQTRTTAVLLGFRMAANSNNNAGTPVYTLCMLLTGYLLLSVHCRRLSPSFLGECEESSSVYVRLELCCTGARSQRHITDHTASGNDSVEQNSFKTHFICFVEL